MITTPYLKFLLPGELSPDSSWLHSAQGGISWQLDEKGETALRCVARLDSLEGTPAAFLSGWDHGVRSPGRALREVRDLLAGHLARLSAHEVNGKLMGVRGLLDTWKDASPDQEAIQEDAPLLLSAFENVRDFVMLQAWLLDEATQEERPLDLQEVQFAIDKAIMKFSPQGGTTTLRLEEKKQIIASPSALVLWILGGARALVDLRKGKESAVLKISGEEDALEIDLFLPGLANRLLELRNEGRLPLFFADWLMVFALSGGKVGKLEPDGIKLLAPAKPVRLRTTEKKPLAAGASRMLVAQYAARHIFFENPASPSPLLASLLKAAGSCG